ncbi:MAG TPA: IS1-like element transposase [Blastocatellia bacterium]|nr:IS1-like element transposase [Blastocatellia bacterium]HMY71787.1 IS1-like element transposase [Blastocatellia bacterium]
MNGSGVRDIARVLLIGLNTVLKTLRQTSTEVSDPEVPSRLLDDECWSFV